MEHDDCRKLSVPRPTLPLPLAMPTMHPASLGWLHAQWLFCIGLSASKAAPMVEAPARTPIPHLSASFSYRDPRLQETLSDFDAAIDWVLSSQHKPHQLEEAILGVIASLDKPASPAGEAKQAFYNQAFGRTLAHRTEFRKQVLSIPQPRTYSGSLSCYLVPRERPASALSATKNPSTA